MPVGIIPKCEHCKFQGPELQWGPGEAPDTEFLPALRIDDPPELLQVNFYEWIFDDENRESVVLYIQRKMMEPRTFHWMKIDESTTPRGQVGTDRWKVLTDLELDPDRFHLNIRLDWPIYFCPECRKFKLGFYRRGFKMGNNG